MVANAEPGATPPTASSPRLMRPTSGSGNHLHADDGALLLDACELVEVAAVGVADPPVQAGVLATA